MNYFFQSIKTLSYWKYALFSKDAIKTFFAVLGAFWLILEMVRASKKYNLDTVPPPLLMCLFIISIIIVLISRRPVTKIKYRHAGKDLTVEVKIGNLFEEKGQKVISTNTTFDTDIANGVIAKNSLQGQFTDLYYPQSIVPLNQLLDAGLTNIESTEFNKAAGKNRKYPMGTVVRINIGTEVFYWLAMSDLNYDNTASTTLENVLFSVEELWKFIAAKGENTTIIVPMIGKGRGRLSTNSKRVIARIAQSFVKASEDQVFSNKLLIMIHPSDAENFEINLFEVSDLLRHYCP
ncbi:macro domain-containing protein [Chitinophaga defluvii]|uniref:Macro domain-containing protein n=1 Tax=Chitinophaga defluvii TaxID=3163343 RepID=A0ABV2TCH7_9BACT